jgi:hypothetical protein
MCRVMTVNPTPANYIVVDDFLDEETWTKIWSDFQFTELHPVTRTVGAWKLDDGTPFGGEEVVVPRPTTGSPGIGESPLELLLAEMFAHPDYYRDLVGEDWSRLSARSYVYPKETGLSWHVDDHDLYAGAFIYYAHPVWNAHWGGELLLADMMEESGAEEDEMPIMAHRFETESYSERLMDVGSGTFIMPKPNRLVLLSGAPHMVARINPAAGAAVRASVSGFFLRDSGELAEQDDS